MESVAEKNHMHSSPKMGNNVAYTGVIIKSKQLSQSSKCVI